MATFTPKGPAPTDTTQTLPKPPTQQEVNQRYLNYVSTFQPPTSTSQTTPFSSDQSSNPFTIAGDMAKDAFGTLIVNPGTRIGQVVASDIISPLSSPEQQNRIQENMQKPQKTLGITVDPQKGGVAGLKQAGGQALKAGSYLYGGEGLGELGTGGNLLEKAAAGAKVGLPAGAMAGAGGELANNPDATLGSTLESAGKGAAIGAAAGAATGPLVRGINETFNPTPEQVSNRALQDVTPGVSDIFKEGPARPLKTGQVNPDGSPVVQSRLNEGKGVFGNRTATNTQLEKDAANELQKIPAYQQAVNGTALDRFNSTDQPLTDLNFKLKSQLSKESYMQSGDDLYNKMLGAVNEEIKVNPTLAGKSETYGGLDLGKSFNFGEYHDAAMNRYLEVLKDTIKNVFNKGDTGNMGTLEDELLVKQRMDNFHKNSTGGKNFQSQADAPTKVLSIMNGTTRDAMTEDLATNATNSQVKPILKQEWDLLRAREELWNKAGDEQGTRMGRFIQTVPRPIRYLGRRAILGPALGVAGVSYAASRAHKALMGK